MFGQNMKQVSKTVSTHLNCLNVMVPINIQTKLETYMKVNVCTHLNRLQEF